MTSDRRSPLRDTDGAAIVTPTATLWTLDAPHKPTALIEIRLPALAPSGRRVLYWRLATKQRSTHRISLSEPGMV